MYLDPPDPPELYGYECLACEYSGEQDEFVSDDDEHKCPGCGKEILSDEDLKEIYKDNEYYEDDLYV